MQFNTLIINDLLEVKMKFTTVHVHKCRYYLYICNKLQKKFLSCIIKHCTHTSNNQPNQTPHINIMAKNRIKDVAQMAGVSPGTVDRVLHNRGNVSQESLKAVQKALGKMNYHSNIHVSAISLKKSYKIVVVIPQYGTGDYWEQITVGIKLAMERYSGISIDCVYCQYDQFDLFSARRAYAKIVEMEPNGVIIGPTFRDEAVTLSKELDVASIPYIYVDSHIEDTFPIAYYISDPIACGYLIAKLITTLVPNDKEIAMMQAIRVGDESANTTVMRKHGIEKFYRDHAIRNNMVRTPYSVANQEEGDKLMDEFFLHNDNIKGVVVLNSRSYIVADYLRRRGLTDVRFVGIDVMDRNIASLKDGTIDFLIGQRPENQGFMAMKSLLEYLVYRRIEHTKNYMPTDIITKENVDTYIDFEHKMLRN